ncbi:MAG: hypothetical protein IKK94_08555 [Clostridia bacterium]|nr:hypothetical protein [Clostridia bacterium]
MLSLSWTFFSPESSYSLLGMIKTLTYLLCYVVGNSMIEDDLDYAENNTPYSLFYWTVMAIALGAFVHYLLNWISNLSYGSRNTVDIWSGSEMAATGQAAMACIPLGLAIACLFFKNSIKIKLAAIITVILVLGYNLVLSGRTLIIMFLIITAVAFSHRFLRVKKGRMRVVVLLLAVILLLLFVYQANILGIRSYIEDSPLYERFFAENSQTELDEDNRDIKKQYFLKNMLSYPWGGMHMREEMGYAHDIFLDTYDEAGIFALLGMVIYILISVYHMFKCVSDETLSFGFRQIVLCVYVICYIEFMVEPILQGMPWLFASFCLIDGYVSRIISHNKLVNRRG